jgi:hypothetical protein
MLAGLAGSPRLDAPYYMRAWPHRMRMGIVGLGDQTTTDINAASKAAQSIATTAQSSAPLSTQIEASAGAALMAAAAIPSPATPFLLIGGAIADLMATFRIGAGCGSSCVTSTNFANQANAALQNNIEIYMALPTPRPLSAQTAALANFDSLWAWLVQQCSSPSLGTAGQKCISDRQSGSCAYTQPASSVPPWGTPPAGACWNWFLGYRDPIAQDVTYDDSALPAAASGGSNATYAPASSSSSASPSPSASASPSVSGIASSLGLTNSQLLLIAGVGVIALLAAGGN